MARPTVALEDAFWQRVEIGAGDECWNWKGAKRPDGYGQYRRGERNLRAHLIALDLAGLNYEAEMVHHVCRNRSCVNPDHLEPMDRSSHSRLHQGEFCKRGHPKSDVYVTPSGERSHCRACQRERDRKYRLGKVGG